MSITPHTTNENILRKNQLLAINNSISNDFQSGIHYHATGTGKSWIAMYILKEFNKKYPNKNVMWICERKDILKQQFSKEVLEERYFSKILSNFNVFDYNKNKNPNWYESLNNKSFLNGNKPFLCIINRSYLTSREKYKNIKNTLDLVIHDECHSIENKTTQKFYSWLENVNKLNNIDLRIIGFSATPELIYPLQNIISTYSIYDGFLDKVILPPKIIWIKSDKTILKNDLIEIMKQEIDKLPYKKIIVWCGIIKECIKLAKSWSKCFQNYDICLDFNNIQKYKEEDLDFKDYNHFHNSINNSILFCAVKHREGSDIPNVDACIFMDKVEKRSERVFIQCMGRVLRLDKANKKKYGLIIDFRAKSTIEICNRLQYYLRLENIFPWNYSIKKVKKNIFVNELDMIENVNTISEIVNTTYTKLQIIEYFIRPIPEGIEYKERLDVEIDLILSKNLFGNIVRAIEILEITKNIPHVTRGSCGSSLVCYLLGISHFDPVKYNISFARFINQYRDTLPDVDFDFPHYLRDEVFIKMFQKWGNKVARISNHNYYHEKSALRESLRKNGIRKFISKFDINKEIKTYSKELQESIKKTQKELEGTFRGYSLHCGGIIYFPEGIPQDKILDGANKSIIQQVNLNKVDVSENKNFKIDILSSRALSQLYYCQRFKEIDFSKHIGDQKTIDMLCAGNNIGITLAETPLMRKALLLIQPKSIMDLALCLSIIRPAAKDAKKDFEMGEYKKDSLIFDDDVIFIIAEIVNCDEEFADKLRRGYCKGDEESIKIINKYINKQPPNKRKKIRATLENLRKYGFCKAHALSYAQLVWQLAYQKAHYPKRFWRSTLKNIDTCYRNWVHIYEAKCHNITLKEKEAQQSIYAIKRNKKIDEVNDVYEQVRKFGYWNMETDDFFPRCYYKKSNVQNMVSFRGLIASTRKLPSYYNKKLILFVGVGKNKYIEIVVIGQINFNSKKIIIEGVGKKKHNRYGTIKCYSDNVKFI